MVYTFLFHMPGIYQVHTRYINNMVMIYLELSVEYIWYIPLRLGVDPRTFAKGQSESIRQGPVRVDPRRASPSPSAKGQSESISEGPVRVDPPRASPSRSAKGQSESIRQGPVRVHQRRASPSRSAKGQSESISEGSVRVDLHSPTRAVASARALYWGAERCLVTRTLKTDSDSLRQIALLRDSIEAGILLGCCRCRCTV
jgi:hypothetical protein